MGDILGDPNTRRARVQGMENVRGNGAGMAGAAGRIQRYATDLRSMTQGRGYFTMQFSHYDIVPSHPVDTIAQRRSAWRRNGSSRRVAWANEGGRPETGGLPSSV